MTSGDRCRPRFAVVLVNTYPMPMQRIQIVRGTSLTIALALFAASCGGSTQAEVASELEAADTATTTTEATTTTTAPVVDVDRYCELAILNEANGDAFFEGDGPGDPAKLEAFFVDLQVSLGEAIGVADPLIKPDLVLVQEEIDSFVQLVEQYDYDLILASSAIDDRPTKPEWEAAQDAVDDYDQETCGLDKDADSSEPAGEMESAGGISLADAQLAVTLMETQAGLDLVVEGFMSEVPGVSVEQAECFLKSLTAEQFVSFAQLGLANGDIDTSDPAISEVLTILDTCDIPLAALIPSS